MPSPLPHKPSILVVDDAPENIDVLKETLKNDYIIRPALNGALALKIAAGKPHPDLILLDIMMPGMDGYEVMRQLQAMEATRAIPVIFVTAMADMDRELQGLELGAVDYITKPFNPPVVSARVHTHLALRQARETLKQQNCTLLHERELVENIITRMRASACFDDRQLRYLIASVDRTNGDILLACFASDGRQWVLVGDFTGHGLPAAVAAPLVSYVFYAQAQAGNPIETALAEINAVLCRQLPVNVFMACCLVEVSADRRRIKLWNAAMPQCVLMQGDDVYKIIPSQSIPLGILESFDPCAVYEQFEVGPANRLYIFSDGIPETANPKGELFGYAGIETFLLSLGGEGKALEALLLELERHKGDTQFADDITLVEVQV
ncbi:MAG: response regulator [Methylococcaceae bacterium]|nr:MAG: response regulator [Methylococcaceae bacterium]